MIVNAIIREAADRAQYRAERIEAEIKGHTAEIERLSAMIAEGNTMALLLRETAAELRAKYPE